MARMRTPTPIGVLDGGGRATVGAAGSIALDGTAWSLDWWVGADDRWHVPACEPTTRQALVGASPVVETRVRVPGGDIVQHAYAARGPGRTVGVVVEVLNDTKVPCALGLALRDTPGPVAVDGGVVRAGGQVLLVAARAPGRVVVAGSGHDPAAVLVFPLAHTASLRVVLPADAVSAATPPGRYPGAAQVAAGWATQSGRGARIEVPDRQLRDDVRAASRFLLLDPGGRDAHGALRRLGLLPGRLPARRTAGIAADPSAPAAVVHTVLDMLVADERTGLALSPGVPPSWYGRGWEVHDLPTRHGLLSYAIRWHGERPALLWELAGSGRRPVQLRVPSLDRAWTTSERRGDALLAPVPVPVEPERRRGLSIPVTIEPVRRSS